MAQGLKPSLLQAALRNYHSCRESSSSALKAQGSPRNLHSSAAYKIDHTSYSITQSPEITAAPEIDLDKLAQRPTRVVPASPSYFTGSARFNDNLLFVRGLADRYKSLPTLPPDQVPRTAFLRLGQYRGTIGERVAASKYSRVLECLSRLNKIPVELQPQVVKDVLKQFQRENVVNNRQTKVRQLDEFGRANGLGRRKESVARASVVEGTGEVLINGKNIVHVFPRLHDRESALWALKITNRMDKYNVFAVVSGGGATGQAESVTVAVARALLVHEPALKPALRRAGCVTMDARRVERKKPGRRKARKRPAWVKR